MYLFPKMAKVYTSKDNKDLFLKKMEFHLFPHIMKFQCIPLILIN